MWKKYKYRRFYNCILGNDYCTRNVDWYCITESKTKIIGRNPNDYLNLAIVAIIITTYVFAKVNTYFSSFNKYCWIKIGFKADNRKVGKLFNCEAFGVYSNNLLVMQL